EIDAGGTGALCALEGQVDVQRKLTIEPALPLGHELLDGAAAELAHAAAERPERERVLEEREQQADTRREHDRGDDHEQVGVALVLVVRALEHSADAAEARGLARDHVACAEAPSLAGQA